MSTPELGLDIHFDKQNSRKYTKAWGNSSRFFSFKNQQLLYMKYAHENYVRMLPYCVKSSPQLSLIW